LATWSLATWPNTASFKPAASCHPCLPEPPLRLTLSTLPSPYLSSTCRDKAAGKPTNTLSSIYLTLDSTKWMKGIMMLLLLFYYMILFKVYILEIRRREKSLHVPSPPSLPPSKLVHSALFLPSHWTPLFSLCHSSPSAMDASKTLVNTSLDLLLAVC